MAGRGPQTFKKKQKEQRRKEKQEEKLARRLERKRQHHVPEIGEPVEAATVVADDGARRSASR
jgi:hypothetical protein